MKQVCITSRNVCTCLVSHYCGMESKMPFHSMQNYLPFLEEKEIPIGFQKGFSILFFITVLYCNKQVFLLRQYVLFNRYQLVD